MRNPAVPLCLALLAGASAGVFVPAPMEPLAAVIWMGLVLASVCLSQHEGWPFALVVIVTAAACGWALGMVAHTRAVQPAVRKALVDVLGPGSVSDEMSDPVVLTGALAEDASVGEEGGQLALRVASMHADGRVRRCDGLVLLSVAGAAQPGHGLAWSKGRTVRVPALLRRPARYLDPGVPDHEVALLRRGVSLVGTVKSPLLVEVLHRGSWPNEGAAYLRSAARAVIDREVGRRSPRSAAIVRAILLGDRTGLDDETEQRMQAAGTYHVLAISGGNIAILVGVVLIVLRLLLVRSPIREVCTMAAVASYAWMVGGGPSVSRATLMAVTMLAARALDHRSRPFNAMAVAGGLGMVANPLTVFDPGTWLTYGASLAIVIAALGTARRLAAKPLWIRVSVGLLVASLAAELALFPVSAFVFSRVTAAGLMVNFVAIPMMTVVQVGAMVMLAVSSVSAAAASAAGLVVHLAAWALVESGRLVDIAPWLTMRLPSPGWVPMLIYYGGWGLLLAGAGKRQRMWSGALVAGAGLWILWAPVAWGTQPRDTLRVTFIDVGQGDATLVQCPNGQSLLMDAGGAGGGRFDIGGRVVAPVLWERGVRRLTYLVVSHGDADHMNGAQSIVRDFTPVEVWEGVPVPPHEPLVALRAAALAGGATWRRVQRGDRVSLGDVDVVVRHPPPADWERQRVRNDDSVVIEVRFRGVSVVLPGDVEATGEQSMLPDLVPAPVLRILQAPHHGSLSSSSTGLVDATRPLAVVISAGRGNRYGHPHREVLRRFAAIRASVFRTDRDGAITFTSDGRTAWLTTFTGRRARVRRP